MICNDGWIEKSLINMERPEIITESPYPYTGPIGLCLKYAFEYINFEFLMFPRMTKLLW